MPEIAWIQMFLAVLVAFVTLGAVALLRCPREDIVKVIRELRRVVRR
ncbi:hypothetical protein [Streptomyces fractus]